MDDYKKYIESKTHSGVNHGFEPVFVPDILFDFQKACLEWACLKGRAALLQDCGLGKTFQQLAWAENIVRKTNGRVLIIAPLAVASQTIKEGEKIGIEVIGRRNGIEPTDKISVTNYEMVDHFNPLDFNGESKARLKIRTRQICPNNYKPCIKAKWCTLNKWDACDLLIQSVYGSCKECKRQNHGTTCADRFKCFKMEGEK